MRHNEPRGPVGLLVQTVHLMGGIINREFEVLLKDEVPLPIKDTVSVPG